MGTLNQLHEDQATASRPESLLISVPALAPEANAPLLSTLSGAFPGTQVTIAMPDESAETLRALQAEIARPSVQLVACKPAVRSTSSWALTAADFFNASEALRAYPASSLLLLGPEAQSLDGKALFAMHREAVSTRCDLVSAKYSVPSRVGLVNSSILYPVSRALFGASTRFPLALDLCLSARTVERIGAVAHRAVHANQPDTLIWPVAEAAAAGFSIGQVEAGERILPQPANLDLNAMVLEVVGSLFAEVEAKAVAWQRVRVAPAVRPGGLSTPAAPPTTAELTPMVDAFRLAYSNLLEVWSLVLPPQSLLGLKRLSAAPAESFVMPDSLWARLVYDFLLGYRMRALNRNHLMGAFTPLYLAWVASHLLQTRDGMDPERHIQIVAAAFEADKPYLVSRWRWPDRFNP